MLSRSRVSRVVDELTQAGMTRREPDATDRRGSSVTFPGLPAIVPSARRFVLGILAS